jgi:hypothetical protein
MGLLSKLQTAVLTPLAATANLITAGLSKVTGKTYGKTIASEAVKNDPVARALSNVILGAGAGIAAIYAAPVVAGAVAKAGGTKVLASKVVTAVTPKTLGGKAIAALSVLPVATAIIKNPQVITKTAGGIVNLESNLIKTAADPSLTNLKNTITENPIIAGAAGLLIGGAALKTILPAAGSLLTAKRTGEQTEAIMEQTAAIQEATGSMSQPNLIKVSDLSSKTPDTPPTPATQPLNSVGTGSKTSRRRARKAKPTSINQSVRVNVINSSRSIGISQTKKYINKELLVR